MAATTLFESEKLGGPANGKRGHLMALLTAGFGAAVPETGEARKADLAPGSGGPVAHTTKRTGGLTRRDYVRGLELMIQHTERARLNQTLVEVTPREIQALVEKAAKAKARYLAAALELGSGEAMPDAGAVRGLETERERHEALEAALQSLLEELRRGNIEIEGVVDDPPVEPQPR